MERLWACLVRSCSPLSGRIRRAASEEGHGGSGGIGVRLEGDRGATGPVGGFLPYCGISTLLLASRDEGAALRLRRLPLGARGKAASPGAQVVPLTPVTP